MPSINGPKIEELRRNSDLLFEAFQKESDRGVALVAAAFFDTTLERLLRARFSFRGDKRAGLMEPLFDVFGPLSTFSSKVRIAYAIDLLQDWIACDLDLVRRIRNEFAHSLGSKAFHESDIASIVNQLIGFTKSTADLEKLPAHLHSRMKFDLTCSQIGALLQAKVVIQESDAPDEMKRSFMITTKL